MKRPFGLFVGRKWYSCGNMIPEYRILIANLRFVGLVRHDDTVNLLRNDLETPFSVHVSRKLFIRLLDVELLTHQHAALEYDGSPFACYPIFRIIEVVRYRRILEVVEVLGRIDGYHFAYRARTRAGIYLGAIQAVFLSRRQLLISTHNPDSAIVRLVPAALGIPF